MAQGKTERDFLKFMAEKKSELEDFFSTLEVLVTKERAGKIVSDKDKLITLGRSLHALMNDHYGNMEQLQLSEPQLAQHRQQVSQLMARRPKLLEGLSRICIDIYRVRADACFSKTELESGNKLQSIMLFYITGNFHNFTDSSLEFCLSLSRTPFFFKDFVKPMLGSWFNKHEINEGCFEAVSSSLGLTYNMLFRSNPEILMVLSETKVVESVVPYLKSSILSVQTSALLLIAFALDESKASMYGTAREAMEYLVSCLRESLDSDGRRSQGYHISELTICLNRLALNDSNKRLLVKLELLPVLRRMCSGDRDDDIVAALDILSTLSRLAENRPPIEQQFLDVLAKLFSSSKRNSKTGDLLRNYRSFKDLDKNLSGRVSTAGVETSQDGPGQKQREKSGLTDMVTRLRIDGEDGSAILRFHPQTGANIQLSRDRLCATRRNAEFCCSEALVFSSRPLRENETLTWKIENNDCNTWLGRFSFGVTDADPAGLQPLPSTFDELERLWGIWFENTIIVAYKTCENLDIVSLGVKSSETVGVRLCGASSELQLFHNGNQIDVGKPVKVPLTTPLWAVLDVYGPCTQVSILPNDTAGQEVAERQYQQRLPPDNSPADEAPNLDASFTSWDFVQENDKKKCIGAGGFGKVFEAFTDRHQFIAVKVIKPLLQMTPEAQRKIFEQEKRALELLTKVTHRNVVRFLKAEEKAGKYFIFCELLSGCTIEQLMMRQGKPIDEDGIRKFIGQTCSALSHLHGLTNPIIHRDIKSSNLMLTYSGTVKLIDFGFAREIFTSKMVTHQQCGTLHFMAPEILTAEDEVAYTPKTDMWAVGCTAFEMATREPPNADVRQIFRLAVLVSTKPMPQLPQSVSSSLRDFYRVCVQQEPGDRPTASELARHRFLAG